MLALDKNPNSLIKRNTETSEAIKSKNKEDLNEAKGVCRICLGEEDE